MHYSEVPKDSSLCFQCLRGLAFHDTRFKLDQYGIGQTEEVSHHVSWVDLVDAKDNGCGICARVWFAHTKTYFGHEQLLTESARITSHWRTEGVDESQIYGREFVIAVTTQDTSNASLKVTKFDCFQLQRMSSFDELRVGRQQGEEEEAVDGSTAAINPMQWLAVCDQSHYCMKSGSSSSYNPPRLLELHKTHARLVDASQRLGTSVHIKYATLSHCWGSQGVSFCLTTENYDDLQHEIILDKLPLTFRHAVEVSLRLGISWLWIDSLCIIQSGARHETDWNLHLNEMELIYANCYVNLAASHASNSSQGLYYSRSKAFCGPLKVQILSEEFHLVATTPMECIVNWKLNTRAWVLQERLLSPRVIHFGQTDVFFECSKGLLSGHRVHGTYDLGDQLGQYNGWPPFDWRVSIESHDEDALLIRWLRISEWYSRCSLTYPTDRLPALSGIARAFNEEYLHDIYIAGYFKKALCRTLLWRVASNIDHRVIHSFDTYIAPSWSWLSINAPVEWSKWGQYLHPTARITASEISLSNPDDMYGRLKNARLHIEGWNSTFYMSESMKTETLAETWRITLRYSYKGFLQRAQSLFFWDHNDSNDPTGSHLTLLCLSEDGVNGPPGRLNGLLLHVKQSPGFSNQYPTYRRVGSFVLLEWDERDSGSASISNSNELVFKNSQLILE